MQLAFITLAMCIGYFILLAVLPLFFAQKITRPKKNQLIPLVYIILFSTLAYAVSFLIQDIELGNRFLHIFGGGFLGFFVCFLATRNSGVHVNKFQFFMFGALIVLVLGIANELLEFILQNYWGFIMSISVNDTWLDLASNSVGVILASIFFVPFHKEIS
jgi:ABC-type Co2+ transport system permease subunit